MYLYIAGRGKMALALIDACKEHDVPWNMWMHSEGWNWSESNSVIVHVGSEERLKKVLVWCAASKTPLIHAASGQTALLPESPPFPIIVAPNLALPFVALFSKILPSFKALLNLGMTTKISEKHQLSKTTESATAAAMMQALEIPTSALTKQRCGMLPHADHELIFTDESGDLTFKFSTHVKGLRVYANGGLKLAQQIVAKRSDLENRIYSVQEILAL
ncbi:MAG: hypothetical protein AAB480_02850 [Patescibacteria group bacterium]